MSAGIAGQPKLKKRLSQFLQQGFLLSMIVGCTIPTPHENFRLNLMAEVGRNIEEVGSELRQSGRSPESITSLANGHVAHTYRYLRTCRITLETNSDTGIIVAARWEGSEKDCVMAP